MEQILELLKSIKDELRTQRTKMEEAKTNRNAWREEMKATMQSVRSQIEDTRREMMACQEKTEAHFE
jgi:uncharacterized protein (DUF3084 family)